MEIAHRRPASGGHRRVECRRIEGVLAHGADSVAVVTDVMRHEDPQLRTKQWIVATAQARIRILQ